jgi:hypothetical protein
MKFLSGGNTDFTVVTLVRGIFPSVFLMNSEGREGIVTDFESCFNPEEMRGP